MTSTPTNKSTSRIREEYELSTQEEWELPCPHCGHYQPLVWDNVVYDAENWPVGGAQYRCEECGCVDKEYSWKKQSIRGRWVATYPERNVRGLQRSQPILKILVDHSCKIIFSAISACSFRNSKKSTPVLTSTPSNIFSMIPL